MSHDQNTSNFKEILKKLSSQDFMNFGIQDIAYVRTHNISGKKLFIIHKADGQKLSVMNSMDDAISVARYNELEPVTVH